MTSSNCRRVARLTVVALAPSAHLGQQSMLNKPGALTCPRWAARVAFELPHGSTKWGHSDERLTAGAETSRSRLPRTCSGRNLRQDLIAQGRSNASAR